MGSISSKGSEDKASQKNKELDNMFQFLQKDIISSLQQLLFWSLAEVRGCYEKFRRSGRQAYIDRTEFSKLMPFTKTNSFFIFGNLVKKDAVKLLSVYELITILTITAYADTESKLKLLGAVFDFTGKKYLEQGEFRALIHSVIYGLARVTRSHPPEREIADHLARMSFTKADVQPYNSQVSIEELIDWVKSEPAAHQLFFKYEPERPPQSKESLFHSFKSFTDKENAELIKLLTTDFKSKNDDDEDFIQESPKSPLKLELSNNSLLNSRLETVTFASKSKQLHLPRLFLSSKLEGSQTSRNRLITDSILPSDHHSSKLSPKFTAMSSARDPKSILEMRKKLLDESRGKIKNIMITCGETVSKNDVASLRNYFYKLSANNDTMNYKDFEKAFVKSPALLKVAASIFNFLGDTKTKISKLDDSSKGEVTFPQLVRKLFPSLAPNQMKNVMAWSEMGHPENEGSASDKKLPQLKKRMSMVNPSSPKKGKAEGQKEIPREAIARMKQIFDLFDTQNKGSLSLEDLRPSFQKSFSNYEFEELFRRCDKDGDHRLNLTEFIHMILPPQFTVKEESVKYVLDQLNEKYNNL